MRTRLSLLALPLLLAAGLVGCDAFGGGGGTFRVLLTDAPGDFESAVVTIDSVYLQGEGGAVVLRDEPATVDLLELQNEVMELVGETAVPAGTYSELRLVISGGTLTVNGESGPEVYSTADGTLQMPSFAQSGLKITLPGGAVEVGSSDQAVLLDFSVEESFGRQAGQSGRWVMAPVIRASDFALTGTAEVSLALAEGAALPDGVALASFSAKVVKDTDTIEVPFADGDGDGTYTAALRYLAPGDHPVTVVAPEGVGIEADVALPLSVTVESGATVRAAVKLTTVTAATP